MWFYTLVIFVLPAGTILTQEALKALAKPTAIALNHTKHAIALISGELTQMMQVVLQNRMALDLLNAVEKVSCAILHAECCVYIPDNANNVSQMLTTLGAEISHILAIFLGPFMT